MKNRAKFISLLVAVCMMITLLPAVALADSNVPTKVWIGNIKLDATNKYYHNGTGGAPNVANAVAEGANATFDASTGTLTLNGLEIVNTVSDKKGIMWDGYTLKIVLNGTNVVANTQGGAVAYTGSFFDNYANVPRVEISGSGTLIATGSSYGILAWDDVSITGGATVIATGVTKYGISTNSKISTITINGGSTVIADGGKYGFSYDNDHTGSTLVINDNSRVVAKGNTKALNYVPTLYSGAQAIVSNDFTGSPATVWNGSTALNSSSYKYVSIAPSGSEYSVRKQPEHDKFYMFFDPNGGSGTMAYNTYAVDSSATCDMSITFKYPGCDYTGAFGKAFTNWKDANGNSYTADTQTNGLLSNTIFYSQWGTGGTTATPTPDPSDPGTIPTPTPDVPTVDASSGIDLWYNGGNSFGSSKGDVPTSVEIDGVPVAFNGSGSQFTVGCVSPNAKWVTVKWHGTTVTTNFTPDANATCSEINIPKTGDASVMAFALMAVVAAAGALRRK